MEYALQFVLAALVADVIRKRGHNGAVWGVIVVFFPFFAPAAALVPHTPQAKMRELMEM